jgi:hypothetical protein
MRSTITGPIPPRFCVVAADIPHHEQKLARHLRGRVCRRVSVACVFCAGADLAGNAVAAVPRRLIGWLCAGLRAAAANLIDKRASCDARLVICRYRALMLKAMGDMCRATRLAIMGAVVSQYFLKCAVARCASKAVASS